LSIFTLHSINAEVRNGELEKSREMERGGKSTNMQSLQSLQSLQSESLVQFLICAKPPIYGLAN